jgi:hypothetical protein
MTITPEVIIAIAFALLGYIGTIYQGYKAKNYKAVAEAGCALVSEVIDFFDPELPEKNIAPAEVEERFGATVPLVASTGLSVGDVTVVGIYKSWVKYEKSKQIYLNTIAAGENVSVILESVRAGSAIIGLKIDGAVYDMKGLDVRDDMIRPAGSTAHEDTYRMWYVLKVPSTIAAGEHTFSVVEGYDVPDIDYKDQVCWFEESFPVQVTVTASGAFVERTFITT